MIKKYLFFDGYVLVFYCVYGFKCKIVIYVYVRIMYYLLVIDWIMFLYSDGYFICLIGGV